MFALLLRPFLPIAIFTGLMGILSGLSVGALLATTNTMLHDDRGATGLLLTFIGLCFLSLLGEVLSDIGTNFIGQRLIAKLRSGLTSQILTAPIDQIERYKAHKISTILNQDIDTISDFFFVLSGFCIAVAVALGCLGYLAFLSWKMFAIAFVAVLIGTLVHNFARLRGMRGFAAARDRDEDLQLQYRAIVDGAKELRINRIRRLQLHKGGLGETIRSICTLRLQAVNIFVTANAFGSALFFLVVGCMLLMQIYYPVADKAVISGFVLVLLYVKGPIEQIVGALPLIGRAQLAFRHVADLSARFSQQEPDLLDNDRPVIELKMHRIELHNACYVFPRAANGQQFKLGPINLKIDAGETLFIVGENGCGKTTLVKLLTGLYQPSEGELLLNGCPVSPEMLDDYRQLFSAIFADYHLFANLISTGMSAAERARTYLTQLEIAHKVDIRDGAFTTLDLSTGQRKRLALVQLYLEGREVLVFDEWAADQDPTFRRVFYRDLLPDFKRQGKTLIVISHDDRYFDAADRLIRLENGQIVEERHILSDQSVASIS